MALMMSRKKSGKNELAFKDEWTNKNTISGLTQGHHYYFFITGGSFTNVTQVHNVNTGGTFVIEGYPTSGGTVTCTTNMSIFDTDDIEISGLW